MPAALIFSHSISPRLQYVADFLSHYYGLSFQLTSSEDRYAASEVACKINYSYHRSQQGEIWMHSHALLFETAIHPVKLECFQKASSLSYAPSYTCFFKAEGDVGFDLFAALFFLITRYEEYGPHKKDDYGRFAHEASLAFKEGFLHLPLINIWLEDFRTMLAEKEPSFATHHTPFTFLPTYDIDMAWSYLNKGRKRNAGALLKLFFTGRWRSLSHRSKVLRKKRPDPYDAYEWMDEMHQRYRLHPIYFFLVAGQVSKWDKNTSPKNPEFQELIKTIAAKYNIGIHPSWASGDRTDLLRKEINWLHLLSQKTINTSRQHFVRFELPATYRRLLDAGIQHDHSMGYGSINGFRASVATPFYWFDVKSNEATSLLVHPFCFMDANAYYEQKLSASEALKELMQLQEITRQVNGTMITLFHNSFLGTAKEFEGWREMYESFLQSVTANAV